MPGRAQTVIQARAEVRERSLDRYNRCVLGQDLVEVEGEQAVACGNDRECHRKLH
jgi:hypothetical protein